MASEREEEVSRLAQLTFRVRCDNIGHGEDVFLLDPAGSKVRRTGKFYMHILLLNFASMVT